MSWEPSKNKPRTNWEQTENKPRTNLEHASSPLVASSKKWTKIIQKLTKKNDSSFKIWMNWDFVTRDLSDDPRKLSYGKNIAIQAFLKMEKKEESHHTDGRTIEFLKIIWRQKTVILTKLKENQNNLTFEILHLDRVNHKRQHCNHW